MKIRPDCTAVEVCWRIGSVAAGVAACAEAISEGQAGRRIGAFSTCIADRSLALCGGSAPGGGGIGTGPGEAANMTGAGAVGVEAGAAAEATATPVGGAARIPLGRGPAAAYWVWTERGSLANREDPRSPRIAASATLMLSSLM